MGLAYIPFLDGERNGTTPPPLPPCQDTDGDLVGLGFRLGLYMLATSFLVIFVRGAKNAIAGQSQITMISYFAVFITLYTHGMAAVTDIEFITITYLLVRSLLLSCTSHTSGRNGSMPLRQPGTGMHAICTALR